MTKLPTQEEINAWLDTKEGKHVLHTMHAIDAARHGMWFDLNDLFFDNKMAEMSGDEQYQYLKELMPIESIYWAAYLPVQDCLVLGDEDNFFEHHDDSLAERLVKFGAVQIDKKFIQGTVAIVKSNEWKIFDTTIPSEYQTVQTCVTGLQKEGHVLLERTVDEDSKPYYEIHMPKSKY